MTKKENTSPAGLMEVIDSIYCNVKDLKADLAVVKDDVASLKSDVSAIKADVMSLRTEMHAEAEATRRHFDVVAEQLVAHVRRHDDKLESLGHRVAVLERGQGVRS